MTQTYLDIPETGDETPERPWALKVSLAISATGILFNVVAWTWANGQRVDYGDLAFDGILGRNGFGYVAAYLAAVLIVGVVSLWLALLGAGSVRRAPWVSVIAGAMAMFLVMVPVVFVVDHGISHWCVGCTTEGVGD
ncbi:MAG: hypothetical protein ACJ73J_08795 [Actinomycetes bacterium]